MGHLAGLAMHGGHFIERSAEVHAQRLVAKAYTQHWNSAVKMINHIHGYSRLQWCFGAGGDDDAVGVKCFQISDGDLIITEHNTLMPGLKQVVP